MGTFKILYLYIKSNISARQEWTKKELQPKFKPLCQNGRAGTIHRYVDEIDPRAHDTLSIQCPQMYRYFNVSKERNCPVPTSLCHSYNQSRKLLKCKPPFHWISRYLFIQSEVSKHRLFSR